MLRQFWGFSGEPNEHVGVEQDHFVVVSLSTGIGDSMLESSFATAVAQPRFRTTLIASFAALALVLAVVGTYGVISYSVTQRTHEIGIRVALGAPWKSALKLVLGQGTALAIAGALIGLAGSFALTGLLRNLLFNVSTTDWPNRYDTISRK